MLIDTHAHVNFSAFAEDHKEVTARAHEQGVAVINVGTQYNTSQEAAALADYCRENIYAVIGLHPVHTYQQMLDEEETHFRTRAEEFDYDAYRELAKNPKVVGIGECGLDYYRLPADENREEVKQLQCAAFIAQIKLAKELNKALVIHCRPSAGTQDAYEDILKILDEELNLSASDALGISPGRGEGLQAADAVPLSLSASKEERVRERLRFEIHSFTGSPETVQKFLDRGAYVGLNGIITFDKTGNMEKVVEAVPLDRIVLETDSPYLTPMPHRGKRNEPSYVKFVAGKIADIKQATFAEVAEQTTANAKKLFNI